MKIQINFIKTFIGIAVCTIIVSIKNIKSIKNLEIEIV